MNIRKLTLCIEQHCYGLDMNFVIPVSCFKIVHTLPCTMYQYYNERERESSNGSTFKRYRAINALSRLSSDDAGVLAIAERCRADVELMHGIHTYIIFYPILFHIIWPHNRRRRCCPRITIDTQ